MLVIRYHISWNDCMSIFSGGNFWCFWAPWGWLAARPRNYSMKEWAFRLLISLKSATVLSTIEFKLVLKKSKPVLRASELCGKRGKRLLSNQSWCFFRAWNLYVARLPGLWYLITSIVAIRQVGLYLFEGLCKKTLKKVLVCSVAFEAIYRLWENKGLMSWMRSFSYSWVFLSLRFLWLSNYHKKVIVWM